MNVSRRTFLKTTLTAVLASGSPLFPQPPAQSPANRKVQEFLLSASPVKVKLGLGSDFTAWTYNAYENGFATTLLTKSSVSC